MITKQFVDYFNSFYGKDGLYPWKENISFEVLEKALEFLKFLYKFKAKKDYVFAGDSVDREFLRDIIFNCNEQEYILYKK